MRDGLLEVDGDSFGAESGKETGISCRSMNRCSRDIELMINL